MSSPSQVPRGAAPKLRERMRQSPVLHSRIVQAYLDPSASQGQHLQQQHVSSENVRQAWLQDHHDAHQESSEDDTEVEQEQEQQRTTPIPLTPTHAPIPVYQHPVVPLPAAVAVVPSSESLQPVNQHHTEHSWNEADMEDYVDHAPSEYDHYHNYNQDKGDWGFDRSVEMEGSAQHGQEQVEEAWGFDEPIDVEDRAQAVEPAVEAAWGFDDNISIEGGSQSGELQVEAAWGFDEDILVKQHVDDQNSFTESTQSFTNNAQFHEEAQPVAHDDEAARGFDSSLHVEETVQPDLHQVEAAWGFDDNIDIEGDIQAEEHSADTASIADETLNNGESTRLEQQQEESAWGFDDNIQIDEPTQPEQHQDESAWGFDDTIDIVTSIPHENSHYNSTTDVQEVAGVDKSTGSDQHVGPSWGFEDKIEIGDTPQIEQIESSWGFDETPAVQVVNEPESALTNEPSATVELALTDGSSTTAEPSYPTMHQAHESDADAWDYDDQVIELVEEAAAQEVHSSSFATNEHNDLDYQDYQQPYVNKTYGSFSEHVVMPPSSATPSAGDYGDEQELSEVVDHENRASQLVQDQDSHADQSTSSVFDHNDNLQLRTTSGESHSIDSVGPSDTVEEAVTEQSWGFDMDEVIGGEDLESANPSLDQYEQAVAQDFHHPEEPHIVPTTANSTHDQTEQELVVPSTLEEPANVEDESKHVNQASDDEHDSEVREVLFAKQHTPVAIPEEAQSSENSPFATNSPIHSRGSVSFEDSKPYYADAAVTSHLLVKEGPAPMLRSDSRGSVGELKRSVSDSEGSDIYGDLSTAYTGRNMSSNRLNELLDDDDYLEHMERGVPMDRSISTPFSDDETPKFVMEDAAVELMERGEPQFVGGAPSEHLETLEDEQDTLPDDSQAASSALVISADAAINAPLSDLVFPTADDTSSPSLPDAIAETVTKVLSPEATTNVTENEVDISFAEETKVDISEPEPTTTSETADLISDDGDAANPFSDAAAIDDSDLWPATGPLLEKANELLSSGISEETPSQESVIDAKGLTHAIDEGLEDAWADQGLDVVVESPSAPSIFGTDSEVKPEMIQSTVNNIDRDTIDGLDGDAWGDQKLDIAENVFSIVPAVVGSVGAPVQRHQDSTVVGHHEPQSIALVEPEQPLVESRLSDQVTAAPIPLNDLKEEITYVDDSKETAVKETIVEADEAGSLLDVKTSVALADETTDSQLTNTVATQLEKSALEVDAWDNQADALDLDTALEEDAWAEQEGVMPEDASAASAAPVYPVDVHQERSVSNLFTDKSDQDHSKPASPVRAFATSPTRVFGFSSTRSSTTTSPVRGFAAFAPKSPQERSVSDLFGGSSQQPDIKPAPRARGFAAFATSTRDIQEQKQSVSDFFSVKPQSFKPSTPIHSLGPVQDNLLKDSIEEDAWDGQDILINEESTSVIDKSIQELEPERKPEQAPEPVSSTLAIEQTIDDTLAGDAWGDDQNIPIFQGPVSITTESHVGLAAAQALGRVTPTLEQSTKPHSPQELTHALKIDQSIDAALEIDAWDNQDEIAVEEILPPKQELEQELPQEPLHTIPETTPAEDSAQEDAYKREEPTVGALSINRSFEAALEEDAWDDQDDTTFGQELDTHQVHQSIERVLAHSQSEDIVAENTRPISAEELKLDHAIDAAMEEDMWADNDMPTFNEPPVQSQDHSESISSFVAKDQSTKETPASAKTEEAEDQLILPGLESPALPTLTGTEGEFDLDKALEDGAWNDMDMEDHLDSSHRALITQDTHIDEQKSQDRIVEEPQERPSLSGSRIGSIIHHTKTAAEIVEDAWGWDEDETGVSLEYEQDIVSPSQNDKTALIHDEQDEGENNLTLSTSDSKETAATQEKTPDSHSPTQVTIETPGNNFSSFAIQKKRLTAETDSGEGDVDSATQSPWQDISPASVSKRSEGGMSIGSEFESEYSIRSLDDEGHVSSAIDREPTHERDTGALSTEIESEPNKGLGTTMSWTDLNDNDGDAWDDDLPEAGPINPPSESKEPSVPTKEAKDSAEVQSLPDISGADSWDFDQDDDLQSESSLSFVGVTTTSTQVSFSRSVKTPDMTESRSFGSLPSPQNKTPTFSSITSSPGQVLTSYQSSIAGSIPVSPSHDTASATVHSTATAIEVEDDSHLPVAIRQQRARLAARGKPLPPISKYKKSTKDTVASQQPSSPLQSSAASPSLAAATSPTISFASPANAPVSPMLANTPVAAADQKYLSPALQKQRERLEKKRAASAARRLAPSESSSFADQSSSSSSLFIAPVKPTSPLLKEATLHSAMKHTSTSPTTFRKSVQLVDRSEPASVVGTTTSPSSFSVEEFSHSTRRRGLSVSSNQSNIQSSTSPSTPAAEGVVSRRSKEVHRPSMFSSASATTTPTSATFSEAGGESNVAVVKSTQNDALRHVSRLSMSSSTAGSGWDDTPEDDVWEEEESGWNDKKALGKGVDRREPAMSRPTILSSTSSSSFYQQSVPGLDDDNFGESSKKTSTVVGGSSSFTGSLNTTTITTTTTTTSSTSSSSYLDSKKVDDYDPYGPMASRSKAKSSFDGDRDSSSYPQANEILIGRSTPSPGVSLLSPTSATSMSHRHDHHHHHQQSGKFEGSVVKDVSSQSSSSRGLFGGGGGGGSGSLVGDISSLLQEKKNSVPITSSTSSGFGAGANLGSDYEPKNYSASKPSPASGTPSAVQQKQALPKSSSWSFGSWVSSAVAAATEKIDQAYESLDPEYSRMKAQSPSMSHSNVLTGSSAGGGSGSEVGAGGDPNSLSPFKKPGYVVGGSSLALGLASISTEPARTSDSSPGRAGVGPASPQAPHRFSGGNKRSEDDHESFASAGTESDTYGAHHRSAHTSESLSPRLTRKNVSGR
ncbi:hypothetical protein EC991_008251 [Linnemannia zychae]|nr:hypothetical protein EC991_008251 [Linnemannia zychae]